MNHNLQIQRFKCKCYIFEKVFEFVVFLKFLIYLCKSLEIWPKWPKIVIVKNNEG